MAEREYHRLARARARSGFAVVAVSRCSLWLAKDHLLSVESNGYTENYKRFYFKDVQALLLRQTQHWKIRGLILAIPMTLFGLAAIFAGNAVASWICGSVAGALGLVLLFDLAAGPTCQCYLRTAVQTEELPALNRVRRARKALARLRPLLAAAQGTLTPEEIPARVREWSADTAPAATSPDGLTGEATSASEAPPQA